MGLMGNIILDMDGTLLDSMGMWENLGSIYLTKKGIVPPADLKEVIENKTLEEAAEYFIADLGIEGTVKEVVQEILSLIRDKYYNELQLKPGVKKYVLSEYEKGSNMCILTTSDRELAIAAMERTGIGLCFKEIFTAETLGLSKRGPEIFLKTCELMGFEPSNTVVYEDALYAVKAAKAAGCHVVAVYDHMNRNDWDEIKKLADEVIE